ncbi:MAG: hypothetical protein H6739_40915 [Alphaproteobacteria bacterium]|nr:hypothetical protein [Alphaproteobacteria bacterium]
MRHPLVILALAGCSEYEVVFQKDDPVVVDSAPPTCEDLDLAPGVVEIDDRCATSISELGPVLEWEETGLYDVYSTPVVGQLTDDNGDGLVDDADIPDIAVTWVRGSSAQISIAVLSGDGSGVHWTAETLNHLQAHPAIGDVNGDGRPDVVASYYADRAFDGYVAYDGSTGETLWAGGTDDHILDTNIGILGVYDLEGDGEVEVVVGDLILEGATGEIRGRGALGVGSTRSWGYGAPMSIAADLDGDGIQEVLAGNTAYGPDAEILWWNQERDGAVAVGNFDEDPEGEMVVSTWGGEVRLQDSDGTVIWKTTLEEEFLGPSTIADVDGDGRPEIAVAGNTHLWVLDDAGQLLWTHPVTAVCSGGPGVSAFDFEGDGVVELVVADDFDVWILDGPTGAIRTQIDEHSQHAASIYPTIADVDADGSAELIVAAVLWTGPERGVRVFGHPEDGWMPARPGWNQHGYGRTQADDIGRVISAPDAPWLAQNSFRAAELSRAEAGSLPLPDAVPQLVDACACDEGVVRVVARVANEGRTALPGPITLTLGAGDGAFLELDEIEIEGPLASGATTEGLVFELDADAIYSDMLELRVSTGDVLECDPDDNTLQVPVPSCR